MGFMDRFNRGKNQPPQEPLLTRADVARFIDRSPARVTQYYRKGQMPEPDLHIGDDNPVWATSTIRSWWLSRGGAIPGDSKRYHQTWDTVDGVAAELLEEEVLSVEGRFRDPGRIHVRVYRAMDGRSPVILLGIPGTRYADVIPGDWPQIKQGISRQLETDTELEPALWILVSDRSTDSYSSAARTGAVPSQVVLVDLDDPDVSVLPADIARLIGQPVEVFPQEYYTEDAIAHRRISADRQDAPTTITIDAAGLGKVLRQMRTLAQASQDARDPAQVDALRFGAGVQADRALQLGQDAKVSARLYDLPFNRDPQAGADDVALAIRVRDRDLSLAEEHLVQSLELDEPLQSRDLETERTTSHGLHYIVRADLYHQLTALRRVLMDPDLPEDSAVRAALTDSERIVADIARRNNRLFERDDRQPMAVTHDDQDVVSIYLDQLQPVSSVASLPYELQRRAKLLLAYEYAQWEHRKLLLDPARGLLAVRGVEPSNLSPETARDFAVSNWRATRQAIRGERPSTEWLERETRHYLADRPKAYLEWPTAPTFITTADFARSRLVAPPASISVERPVFLRAPDDTLVPLPLAQTNFRGHVWGVSGTDSISRAVHWVLTDAETRDWQAYPNEADDPGLAAYRHVTATFAAYGGEAVDIDCGRIAQVYAAHGILRDA